MIVQKSGSFQRFLEGLRLFQRPLAILWAISKIGSGYFWKKCSIQRPLAFMRRFLLFRDLCHFLQNDSKSLWNFAKNRVQFSILGGFQQYQLIVSIQAPGISNFIFFLEFCFILRKFKFVSTFGNPVNFFSCDVILILFDFWFLHFLKS